MRADYPRVTHPCATILTPKGFPVRLACVRHAASVRSEPGSNSHVLPLRVLHSASASQRHSLAFPLNFKQSFLPLSSSLFLLACISTYLHQKICSRLRHHLLIARSAPTIPKDNLHHSNLSRLPFAPTFSFKKFILNCQRTFSPEQDY